MSFLLDPRAGSKSLEEPLKQIGVPVQMEQLVAGDASFIGRGPGDRPVSIGVEYKTLGDLLSCIVSGRFADVQLPGLRQAYELSWLLVEGIWRPGPNGELHTFTYGKWQSAPWTSKTWRIGDLNHWLTTMEVIGGVHIARTASRVESAYWLKSLYSWWTAKQFEDHNSHRALKDPTLASNPFRVDVPLVERVAACLPGIGPKRATAVAEHFGSVSTLANAGVEAWEEIDGIGKTTASKVVAAIGGGS